MPDNLNYQQARAIRKTKFSDLYLDALSQKGTGVFGALRKTISLRTQAKTKGLKEKFDPLNIVKFLTFGSKLGPALYGKMMGRDQKDIDYFTGRARHVTGGRNTADKIKGNGTGDDAGMNEQLAKIFSFLKSNREDDVKLREEAKNHEEEIAMEKERRHKELIKTLEKLMKQINSGGTVTATKESGPSFLDGLWEKIKGLAELLSNLKTLVFDIAKQIGGPIAEALKAGGRYAAMGLEAAAVSGALTVGTVFVVGAGLTYGLANVLDNMSDEQLQELTNDTGSDTALAAQALLNGRNNTPEQRDAQEKTLEKYRNYLSDAPFATRIAAAYSKDAAGDYLRNVAKVPKADLDAFEKMGLIPEAPTATPVKNSSPTNESNSAPAPSSPPSENENLRPTMQNDPRLNQVTESNPSPVSSLSNTNVELNLPADNSGNSMANAAKRSITALNSRNKERSGLMPSQISVRNEEPTYNELIAASIRMT